VVISFIQGFLPTVLLALLFMLVPLVLRILARLEGIPQKTGMELSLMDRFFLFQVIVCGHFTYQPSISKIKSERLPGCHPLVWNHRIFTWASEQPDISSDTTSPEFTEIIYILSHVRVHLS